MGFTTLSSGIRALDLRAMATDGASGAQGAKVIEISPYSHPPPHLFQPPRPPDPEDVRRRLLIEREERLRISREETAAFCHKVRQNTAAFSAEVEAFRSEMSTSFREMQLRLSAQFDALMERLEPAGNPSLRFGCFGSLPPPSDSPVPRARGTTPSSTDGLSLSMLVGNSAGSGPETPQSGLLPTPASYYTSPPQPNLYSPPQHNLHATNINGHQLTSYPPPHTSDSPALIHHATDSHLTQPIYIHRKQLRVLRRRVSLAATRRQFKATQNTNLLSSVGNDARTQVHRKQGIWPVKAQHGYVFSKIMDEIRQICEGIGTPNASIGTLEPPATHPSPSPLLSNVPGEKEDPHSMAVSAFTGTLERPRQPPSSPAAEDGSWEDLAKVMPSHSDGSCGLESTPASNAVSLLPVSVVVESLELDALEKHDSNVDGFILDEDYPCPVSNIPLQVTLHDELSQDEFAPVSLCHSDKARRVVSEAAKCSFASTAIVDSHGLLDSDSWEDILSTRHLHDQMQVVLLDIAGEQVVDAPTDITRTLGKTLTLGSLIAFDKYGSSDSVSVDAIMIIANAMGENSNDGDESLSLMDKWQRNWVQDTVGGTQFLFGAPSITTIFPQPLIDRVFCRRSLGILSVGYRKLLLEFKFGLRPGGYFLQPASSISHKFQGVAAMKVTHNDRTPNQLPPPCYKCSMLVWNYNDKTFVNVSQVTQLQLIPELMELGKLLATLCISRTTQIIGDIGKAENAHTGIDISMDLEQDVEMGCVLSSLVDMYGHCGIDIEETVMISKGLGNSGQISSVADSSFSVEIVGLFACDGDPGSAECVLIYATGSSATEVPQFGKIDFGQGFSSYDMHKSGFMLYRLGSMTNFATLHEVIVVNWNVSLLAACAKSGDVNSGHQLWDNIYVTSFSFSIVDQVVAFVNNISELPFVRYYDAPLPSPGDGVFPMTYMLKFFHQYTVRHVYQDILFVVTNFSILYSPCHALGKNWSPLLPMPTLQLFSYGAIRNGNYCYHLSCWIYFPDFKTTWFIQFVCGKPVASVEFYVKMHGFGTSPFMWVLGSVINILVHHIDNQLVGWNLVVKVFETPKDNAMGPNSDKCKWIGLSNTCLQGVTMLLAVIVEAFGPHQSHDSGIADLLERVSLLIHTPPSLVGATNYGSRTDAGYSESNRKTSCAVIMARLKVCLLLILAVLTMSLTCELKEKPQCVKTLILNVKLEDKLFLKEAGML